MSIKKHFNNFNKELQLNKLKFMNFKIKNLQTNKKNKK
jgi:hypothetical protein